MQPWRTPFPIWNQSVVPCPVLTVASWLTYRCLIQISDTDLATYSTHLFVQGFPGGASGKKKKKKKKKLPANEGDTRDMSSIPRSGRSPGGGNGIPLQYSCLENPMYRGTCQATVHGLQSVRHNWAHTYNEHLLCARHCSSHYNKEHGHAPVFMELTYEFRTENKWKGKQIHNILPQLVYNISTV